jgi:hypothetical protein
MLPRASERNAPALQTPKRHIGVLDPSFALTVADALFR